MRHCLAASLALLCLAGGAVAAPGAAFYVSTAGRDAWTGRLAQPNAKKTDGPFASLQRSLDAVRAERRVHGRRSAVAVQVRAGTYYLTRPLTLDAELNGSAAGPTVISAYPGERPLLSGGLPLKGFREAADGSWQVTVPEVKAGKLYFRQLWVNGRRAARPRLPAEGTYTLAAGGTPPESSFAYAPGDLDPSGRNRADLEVVVLQYWTEARLRIAKLDDAGRIVTFTGGSWRPLTWSMGYYVENVAEALGKPGEWYLDRGTGVLQYLPLPGENPAKAQVVAPVLEQLVRLEGTAERPVEHVTLRGLRFAHASWALPAAGLGYPQAELPVGAALTATYARNCVFADCEIAHADAWGLELGRGCQNNRVTGCLFEDLGAGGLKVGEAEVCPEDEDEACGTLITDNTFRDGARSYFGGPAVWIGQSSRNTVSHNEMAGSWQWAVSAGWNWSYARTRAHDNVVEYNYCHDIGTLLGSHSTLYTLGIQPGTIIRHNRVEHCQGYGIGLDQSTTGVRVENNLVHHNRAGLHFNWDCLGDIITNNIFALNGEAQWTRYGDAPQYDDTNCNVLQRNIVVWNDGRLWVEPKWPNHRMILMGNVYYDYSGKPVTFLGFPLGEWRAKGMWLDKDSVVADPLFEDPERGNFALKAESPALKLGFVPFDVSTAGPRMPPGAVAAE